MVDMRTHGLDGIEPNPMNEIEIVRRQRRRMSAQMIYIYSSAVPVNDQPEMLVFGFIDAFPCFTQKPALFRCGQGGGFTDAYLG
jgi:hypothetical protein